MDGQSPPLHEAQFLQVMHIDRVCPEWVQHHCTLLPEVGQTGAWEMMNICTLFLSERRQFSYDFGSQVLDCCPIPADGIAGWQPGHWMST